jgi:hypothetical protein
VGAASTLPLSLASTTKEIESLRKERGSRKRIRSLKRIAIGIREGKMTKGKTIEDGLTKSHQT